MAPLRHLLLRRRASLLPLSSSLHTSPSPPLSSLLAPSTQSPPPSDPHMDDFLSRFAHKMKRSALRSLDRPSRDALLLLLSRRIVPLLRRRGARGEIVAPPSPDADTSPDLVPHIWTAALDASAAAIDDMRRARKRDLMRRFLHSGDVKSMCHFAAEAGIRGNMLRQFRFKWALQEMEQWEFLEGLKDAAEEDADDGEVIAVPERKGRIAYGFRELDLSDTKWTEATDRVEEAEGRIEDEEARPMMGKSRIMTEKVVGLDEDGDPAEALRDWAEVVEPRRADWMALLDRIKERNQSLYMKVAEYLLNEESFQSNIRDYSRLLEAYSNASRFEDAERILQKMTEKDIKPDILTSVILVHMYSQAGNLGRAKEEFESLRNLGFQPNYKLYESMIRASLKFGHAKDAESLIREMDNYDMKPPKDIYIETLRAFSQHGQVDGAQRIVYTMQYAGIPQTLESHTLLIESYTQAGDPDQARNSFDLMIRSGQRPDDRSTAAVLAAYEKKNFLDKALDFLLNLEKDGFKPGISTYSVLVDWLGRLLLVDEVEQLLVKIKEKGDLPFNIHIGLCDMYFRAGIEDRAQKSLKILLAKKELLKGVEFERIISGLLAGGFTHEAKRVSDIMQEQGFKASEAINVALLTAEMISVEKPRSRR